jgi:hypothetical protein
MDLCGSLTSPTSLNYPRDNNPNLFMAVDEYWSNVDLKRNSLTRVNMVGTYDGKASLLDLVCFLLGRPLVPLRYVQSKCMSAFSHSRPL